MAAILTRPQGVTSRPTDAVLPSTSDANLGRRLDTLAEENRKLRERLQNLELRPAPAQRAPITDEFVSREDYEAFRDEVLNGAPNPEAGGAVAKSPSPSELEDLRSHVAEAVSEIRKKEAAAKFPTLEQRAARLDQTMLELEDWLALTRRQSNQMRSVLLAQYEREADVFLRWQDGEDPEALAVMKHNDREVHQSELAEVLTPDQLETYSSRGGRGGK